MAINENEFIKESAHNLEQWERTPKPRIEDFVDMSEDEKSKLLVHLFEQLAQLDEERRSSDKKISELVAKVTELTGKLGDSNVLMSEMAIELRELRKELKEKDALIAKLQSLKGASKKERFGSRSQKRKNNEDDENRRSSESGILDAKGT